MISALNNLALVLKGQGRIAEADAPIRRALEISEDLLVSENPDLAATLMNWGDLLIVRGDFASAEVAYRRSLAISEKTGDDHDPAIAGVLGGLADVNQRQGRYGEAEKLYLRALTICRRRLGAQDPLLLETVNGLANLYVEQHLPGKAEPLFRECVAGFESVLGINHARTAIIRHNLASAYSDMGKYAEAEREFRIAIARLERSLGDSHPAVAAALANLAVLCVRQQHYIEAEQLARRAVAIMEKRLGPEHYKLAPPLVTLGEIYSHQKQYSVAAPFFQRAVAIQEKTAGPDHPDTAVVLSFYSQVLRKTGRKHEARRLEDRAKAIVAINRERNPSGFTVSLRDLRTKPPLRPVAILVGSNEARTAPQVVQLRRDSLWAGIARTDEYTRNWRPSRGCGYRGLERRAAGGCCRRIQAAAARQTGRPAGCVHRSMPRHGRHRFRSGGLRGRGTPVSAWSRSGPAPQAALPVSQQPRDRAGPPHRARGLRLLPVTVRGGERTYARSRRRFSLGVEMAGPGSSLNLEEEIYAPDSLGELYGRVTELLGFRANADEHKVQWMSATGDDRFVGVFQEMIRNGSSIRIDRSFFDPERFTHGGFSSRFLERLGVNDEDQIPADLRAPIAAGIQRAVETAVTRMAGEGRNLCLAGGMGRTPFWSRR